MPAFFNANNFFFLFGGLYILLSIFAHKVKEYDRSFHLMLLAFLCAFTAIVSAASIDFNRIAVLTILSTLSAALALQLKNKNINVIGIAIMLAALGIKFWT